MTVKEKELGSTKKKVRDDLSRWRASQMTKGGNRRVPPARRQEKI